MGSGIKLTYLTQNGDMETKHLLRSASCHPHLRALGYTSSGYVSSHSV